MLLSSLTLHSIYHLINFSLGIQDLLHISVQDVQRMTRISLFLQFCERILKLGLNRRHILNFRFEVRGEVDV
jgi:hypothetical protein